MSMHASPQPSYLVDTGTRKGLLAWLTTTDHKRIALLYLYAMSTFFLIAMGIGFVMRLVQLTHFQKLITAQTYNALFTVHGVIMIFLFVIPGLSAVFGNFFLPILIGAKDVSFPRLNLASWYFFMAGAILAVLALFTGGGAPDTGWSFYAPFSLKTGTNVSLAVFAAFILGSRASISSPPSTACGRRACSGSGCPSSAGPSTPPPGSRSWPRPSWPSPWCW
jgi:cytochrome c oxidase subunit 1